MKTKDFYRVDYFPANNKETGHFIGFFDDYFETIVEMDNLQKRKNDLLKQVDPLIAKKKKLYSDVDITTPKSSDEKKLDKEIADLFSEINDLVHKIVKLKKSHPCNV